MYAISCILSSYYKMSVKRMAENISMAKPFFLLLALLLFILSFLSSPFLSLSFPLFSSPCTCRLSPKSVVLSFLSSWKCADCWGHLGTWGQTSLFPLQASAPAQRDQQRLEHLGYRGYPAQGPASPACLNLLSVKEPSRYLPNCF